MRASDTNFSVDLRYRKLLTEYSALLLAIGSITLGILVFFYNVTKDIIASLLMAAVAYLVLMAKKDEVEGKLLAEISKSK